MFLAKYILRDLIKLQDEFILTHLIEGLIYPKSIVQDDATTRLYYAFHSIPRVLKMKKRPKVGFLFRALTYHNDMIEDILQEVVSDLGKVPQDFDLHSLEFYIQSCQYWLAECLSICGRVSRDDVFTEVSVLADRLDHDSYHTSDFN